MVNPPLLVSPESSNPKKNKNIREEKQLSLSVSKYEYNWLILKLAIGKVR